MPAGKVNVRVAASPAQTVTVPLILAVGVGLTVTTALPVIFGLGAETLHPVATSATLTMV